MCRSPVRRDRAGVVIAAPAARQRPARAHQEPARRADSRCRRRRCRGDPTATPMAVKWQIARPPRVGRLALRRVLAERRRAAPRPPPRPSCMCASPRARRVRHDRGRAIRGDGVAQGHAQRSVAAAGRPIDDRPARRDAGGRRRRRCRRRRRRRPAPAALRYMDRQRERARSGERRSASGSAAPSSRSATAPRRRPCCPFEDFDIPAAYRGRRGAAILRRSLTAAQAPTTSTSRGPCRSGRVAPAAGARDQAPARPARPRPRISRSATSSWPTMSHARDGVSGRPADRASLRHRRARGHAGP